MLRLAFDFIIAWREIRARPNAYISLDEYLKKISVTVSPEDPEKPDEGEGGGDEGGGSGEAPDPAA